MHESTHIKVFLVLVASTLSLGEDYYEILGVNRTADRDEIRRAFKKLAIVEHPDKNNDNAEAHKKFIQLTKAYETLKDPASRKRYDLYGQEQTDTYHERETYRSWSYYAENFETYDEDPWVVTLDEDDYLTSVVPSEKEWMVNFYSPLCSHCHRLIPTWKNVAEDLDGVVRIGAINCEDNWQLCRRIGITSYPTLLYFAKNSRHGTRYTGERTHAAITNFLLDELGMNVEEAGESLESLYSCKTGQRKTPLLIFLCGPRRYCSTHTERLKVAAVFENTMDVQVKMCDDEKEKCGKVVSHETAGVLYLPPFTENTWQTVRFEEGENAKVLINRVLELLPEPRDLSGDDLERLTRGSTDDRSHVGWLVCFYVGRATELNLTLKRLLAIVKTFKLGKLNCGKYSRLCANLSVNRYPMWGVVKPGGAFELNHGNDMLKDIVKFAENSIKAKNVWALSAEKVSSILERKNGNEAWFLDWYAPWCPPCTRFLREVRKASLEFDESIVRFGTIDCTVHSTICRQQDIRSYPTAMLLNGSDTHKFSARKTAPSIVRFINEVRNPTVIRLTWNNFEERLGKRKGKETWIVEYLVPWCEPCQRLEPVWAAVARSLAVLPFVKVASVDCETQVVLCTSQNVRSYPTIRIYSSKNGDLSTYTTYDGQRDAISILAGVSRFFPRRVQDLDSFSFRKKALTDPDPWIIDFFVPWCENCRQLEPQLAIAAQLLEQPVKFGRLNCDIHASECARARIRWYPTVMAYDHRYGGEGNARGFVIEGDTAEVIKRNIFNFITRIKHEEL